MEWIKGADPRLIDAALLALLVLGGACAYTLFALRVGSFQPDEWYYMELARFIAHHFPAGLWQEGIYWRGVQRIDQLLLAVPFAFLRGARVYEAAHLIQALLFASAAIPVWLLARACGLGRWACALAAGLILSVPWAIVSTSFLAESAAYPAYAWVLYLTWRVSRRPSRVGELLALAALVVAAFSRTALLAMAPILPLALIWQLWRFELRDVSWRARFRALPVRLFARHPVVSAITALALAAILANLVGLKPGGGLAALTGNYGLPKQAALNGLPSRYDYYLSRMVVGTGGIAIVLGLAWTLRTLARPRDGDRHALAVVSVLGIAVVLLSLVQAGSDERYVLYGAIPIGLTFAAELDSRWRGARAELWPPSFGRALSVILAAAIVIVVFSAASWPPPANEYAFFTFPAATFYSRAVLNRLPALPGPLSPAALVDVGLVIAVGAWLLVPRMRRLARPAVIAAAAIVLGACVTELGYSLEKFTTSPAALADGSSGTERSWLERLLPAGTRVAVVGMGLGETVAYEPVWRTAEFWNTAIQLGVSFQPWGVPTLPFGVESEVLSVHEPSGRVSIAPIGSEPALSLPRYLLVPRQTINPDQFAAKLVAYDPVLPLSLVRLSRPPQLEWSLAGTSTDGFMVPGKPASATVYEDALKVGARCASFELVAPATFSGKQFSGSWPYSVTNGSRETRRGRLAGGQTVAVEVPLHPSAVRGGSLATLTVRVRGKVKTVDGSIVSARLVGFAVGACKRAG